MDYTHQQCPLCFIALRLVDDYAGGGSRYYAFECDECRKWFVFDTYQFILREWVKDHSAGD